MSDWAMYSALSGTDNWARKRQDRAQNLMLAEKMEQRAQRDLDSQMKMEQGINEYLSAISNFDVLPEDQERVNEMEKETRRNVIRGITKFNGDLKKYMASGGLSDLSDYKNTILKSEEFKNASANKQSYAQYIEAKKNGMFVGKGVVQVPVYDKNGKVKFKNGKPVTESKKVSMEQQMALFKKGIINRISVGDIEKKVTINSQLFKQNYKDARTPWAKDNLVSEQDVYNQAILSGSEEQARQIANDYGRNLTKENALRWKAMDETELIKLRSELQKNKSIIEKNRASSSKSSTGKSKRLRTLNTLPYMFNQLEVGEMTSSGYNSNVSGDGMLGKLGGEGNIKSTKPSPISNEAADYWAGYLGKNGAGSSQKVYDANYGNYSEEARKNGAGLHDITQATKVVPVGLEKLKIPGTNEVGSFVKLRVTYDERTKNDENTLPPFLEDYEDDEVAWTNWEKSEKVIEVYKKSNLGLGGYEPGEFDAEKIDSFTGFVYRRIDNEIKSKPFLGSYNTELGLKDNLDNAPESQTLQSAAQDRDREIDKSVSQLKEAFPNWSDEKIRLAIEQTLQE